MMVDPENTNHHKTESISNNVRKQVMQIMPERPRRTLFSNIGDFYGQHHNSNDDGDNTITKSFYPGSADFHSKIFRTQQYKYQAKQNPANSWYGFFKLCENILLCLIG